MKKITDESLAKALGWKQVKRPYCPQLKCWTKGNPFKDAAANPPAFTTSLSAIVAEIEARGLSYKLECSAPNFAGHKQYRVHIFYGSKVIEKWDTTAPLALCAALLAYLKEKP